VHQWSSDAHRDGSIVSLDAFWALADRWYRDRLNPDWQRLPAAEVEALFTSFGLVGPFWELQRR
jgi:hypothetical protein